MDISVIGLGKLGLCSACCFAWRGHRVIAVDSDTEHLARLHNHRCDIDEPGLAELFADCRDNLTFTNSVADAVRRSDVTLIIVPTPSTEDGSFSNDNVTSVLRQIGPALADKQTFHVVDIVSTVMPSSCENDFIPLLEQLSGGFCRKDFGLVYNPEFIAIGSVIRDFLNPDMVLIGSSDETSTGIVRDLYASTTQNEPNFACMSLLNAEITKLSLNCYVTMKISFANELASVCERLPAADVDVITNAIGSDTRIGRKYLKGGLGFGGPCFPRDNIAFQAFARRTGTDVRLGPGVVAVNDCVIERLFDTITNHIRTPAAIAVLGLSYKPGTHIVEESQSITLVQKLSNAGFRVVVNDPRALDCARKLLGSSVEYQPDPYLCVEGTDVAVFMTDWPQYRKLDWRRIENAMKRGAMLVDSWRIAGPGEFERVNYKGLGLGDCVDAAVRPFPRQEKMTPKVSSEISSPYTGIARAHDRSVTELLQRGDLGSAIDTLNRALDLQPDDANTLNNLGTVYRKAGDNRRALQTLVRALRFDPDHRPTVLNIAGVYKDAGMTDEARQLLETYARRWPQDVELARQLRDLGGSITPAVVPPRVHNYADQFAEPSSGKRRVNMQMLGTGYGSAAVDLDLIPLASTVISAGVGEDISFDQILIELRNCTVIGIDPTEKAARYVAGMAPANFHFIRRALAPRGNEIVRMYRNGNPEHVSESVTATHSAVLVNDYYEAQTIGLQDILEHYSNISVLKMDIEGAEYDVLASLTSLDVPQVCVAFHHVCTDYTINDTMRCMEHLREMGYIPAHVRNTAGPYNEVTFLHEKFMINSTNTQPCHNQVHTGLSPCRQGGCT
jgi:UDPglucose 6-dehydrogenase